ncbi:hypothetical protein GBA52_025028 [Prunus armeniaca]|nr:hypothetical protein GBA52_025028 [Prunus armeniaca]
MNEETGQPLVSSYRASGWGNHARRTSCVLHMCTKIFKGNWEWVNWRTTFAVKSARWSRKSLPDTCVLSTGTCKYIKPTVNGETSEPPVQSSRASGWQLGTGKLARHLQSQIGQVAGKIIVGHLCTKYRYTQIRKADCEPGNEPTTCVVISSTWLAKSWSKKKLCTEHRYTIIFKGNWEWTNSPITCAVKSGSWMVKSLLDPGVLSTGTRKYLKPTVNEETGQRPAQLYRAGGWGNQGQRTSCALHMYTKIFKDNWEWGNWPTTGAVKSGKRLGKSMSDTCVLITSTRKYLKLIVNRETGQPLLQLYRVGG